MEQNNFSGKWKVTSYCHGDFKGEELVQINDVIQLEDSEDGGVKCGEETVIRGGTPVSWSQLTFNKGKEEDRREATLTISDDQKYRVYVMRPTKTSEGRRIKFSAVELDDDWRPEGASWTGEEE